MNFANARYDDLGHIEVEIDGALTTVPPVVGNRHYDALVAAGVVVAPYVPPGPTADDVRAEAQRRMMLLTGARDAAHLDLIVSNGTREAIRLLRKGSAAWSSEEAERAGALELVDVAIEAIRVASNAIEAEPPADFTDDRYWPQLSI